MPVNQRGPSSWEAAVTKKGRRFRRSFSTKALAEQWEADAKAALMRGDLPDMGGESGVATGMTMRELYDYTYKNRWKGKSRSLARNGMTCVTSLGANVPVSKVDTRSIDFCVQSWADEGNCGSTINRKLAALSTMMTEAVRLGVISSKPYLRRQKESESRLRWFTKEEEDQIIAYFRHIGQHEVADICIVAVDTGLRKGTLLALDHTDITIAPEGEKSWVHLDGAKWKNDKTHNVPLTKRVVEILAPRVKAGGQLFTVTYDSLSHHWEGMRDALGMAEDKQFVFHVFRHTFCSRLVQKGVPIEVVQKLAGHATLQMTMRYAKLAPKNLSNAIDVLEEEVA